MVGPVLRAGAWPAVAGVSGVAVVVGGCGAAFPAAATMLFPICFALLAAAAAFTLDEPASLVVDVTPTGPVRRTRIRALALLAPLAAGGAGDAGGGNARTGAALDGGRSRAGRQRAARIRRGVRGPDADRRTGRGDRHRRRAGADGAQPGAAGRALGPHVPGARRRRAVLGPRVVDRPRGVRGGHRHLDRWPKPAPVDVQCSVIPAATRRASRPAAPSTLRRSSRPPTAASARQPSRAAHNPNSKRMCRYETVRRALVHRVLRVSIATAVAIAAVTAGLLTSLAAPAAVAVVVGVTAAVGGQAIRGRLEHAADRWVLGSRLAGYANLNRFGRSLIQAPGSDELLSDLAGEVRRGLGLTWARISLDAADGPLRVVTDGTPGGEPGATVPIEYRGTILGRIECGPRSDGPLLAEDRRLLAYFAAQAAVGVHNLHLAAELSRRIEEVRDQAAELAASRDRVVAGQDAERRRIQRNLHDGVQQEIVALSARAGLVRQQLLRGDPAAAGGLADMQRDLATTLQDVREIAYAIHPPVLSDRGLLEAIEAQSSRVALPMAVRADPRLRGVRFGEQIEVTAWYVLAEALSNVVKHAEASEVEVSLSQEDGRLGLVIRDDGRGFDLDRPRGLGLTGLSDRLDTVGGSLTINSGAGLGTSVCVHIPVGHDQQSGLEQVVGREHADA